jgi:proteic killer suppression protein
VLRLRLCSRCRRGRRIAFIALYHTSFVTLDVTHNLCDHTPTTPDDPQNPGRAKYRDKRTERFAHGARVREFQAFARQAYRRLEILEAARSREALMLLPGNRFEALGGDRKGQYSIRINQQWRICFEWSEGEPEPFPIEITDYH